jgi:hypothetical protein
MAHVIANGTQPDWIVQTEKSESVIGYSKGKEGQILSGYLISHSRIPCGHTHEF